MPCLIDFQDWPREKSIIVLDGKAIFLIVISDMDIAWFHATMASQLVEVFPQLNG
jgi:hypothetical protein